MSIARIAGISISLIVALLVAISPAWAQQKRKLEEPKGHSVPAAEIDDAPLVVFRNIEKAWQAENAQALSDLLSESRVFMEIRGIDRRGGYFTKPQILYIFKDMFGNTTQTMFTFVKYQNLEKQDSKIYGMAMRSYKINQSGGLYKDKVYITLVREGSRWAVAEIKSTW
jgi:hypothetical protein